MTSSVEIWENVHKREAPQQEYHHLKRVPVPGGWLYHSAYIHNFMVLGSQPLISCHMAFVPYSDDLRSYPVIHEDKPTAIATDTKPAAPKFKRREAVVVVAEDEL